MSELDFAAGASAARNKVAAHLRSHGIPVAASGSGSPPTDSDFLRAIRWVTQKLSAHSRGSAVVVFQWRGNEFQVPVTAGDLARVRRRADESVVLFDAKDGRYGRSSFFLAQDQDGAVAVFRQKHWRNDPYEFDRFSTTIFELS